MGERHPGGRSAVIVWTPGSPVWDLNQFVPWFAPIVIGLTILSALAACLLIMAVWFRPPGLRCVLAICAAVVIVHFVGKVIAHHSFVARPFVTDHFTPLYPHSTYTSFPSVLTAFFAAIAAPMFFAWRRAGWVTIAIALEVAFGCTYVGVHYVSDVAAGLALGGIVGGAAWWALSWRPLGRGVDRIDAALHAFHLRPRPVNVEGV